MNLVSELRPIDDRSFEDLVAEARARIPRYAPEWTDLNDNDFGIALVQLFAWLAEQQIFRMGRVPELNYIKFLEMVGVTLRPALPARAEITFPVKPGFAQPSVAIPLRTQVAATTQDGSGPIVFETERAITALEAQLDRIQTGSGAALRDVSAANLALDERFDAFGPTARDGAVLALGFNSAAAFPEVELDLAVWVAAPRGRAPAALRCGSAAASRPPADIVWESWDGAGWQDLTLLADDTLAFTRSGHVRLRGPAPGQIALSGLGAVSDPRYWIRARLVRGGYTHPPELTALRTNTAPALQAQTVEGEVLGATDATLDQVLSIGRTPVISGDLEIDEGSGFLPWQQVPDFFGSGPDDPHYVLNRRTGEILFGDGDAGRLPVGNPSRPGANAQMLRYRFGGGARGNVATGALTSLRSPIQGIDTGALANLFAAEGGREAETLDEAIDRARGQLAARDRAVTPADHEALALQAGPVARAKALPLHHPDFPGVEVPGVTSVVILPDQPDIPAPMPSPDLLRQVCDYLDPRRLLTAELYVLAPTYLDVTISAELFIEEDADAAAVIAGAIDTLDAYFHPLTGGGSGRGWPFGGDIYYSRVASLLLADGVRRLGEVRIALGRDEYAPCADAPVPPGVLLRNAGHKVIAFYEEVEDA